MAYQKKVYRSMICAPGCTTTQQDGRRTTSGGRHQGRGGTPGRTCDTGYGAKGNLHKSPHHYPGKKRDNPRPE